ncbi:MAG: DUF4625 domain-containing protein [Bacteroidetes bacterium]|nr:DUF4625 domain-containing protein [Bacteroidota bacterium]
MKMIIIFITGLIALMVTGCIEKADSDESKPDIQILSPQPCDTLYFGETFNYQVLIGDESGLGNMVIDIHHNFGHHSHGDHETCNMDPKKDEKDPFTNSWDFALPDDSIQFRLDTLLSFPLQLNDTTLYDTGDYHFHIYVSNNNGYQAFTSLDVKVLYSRE